MHVSQPGVRFQGTHFVALSSRDAEVLSQSPLGRTEFSHKSGSSRYESTEADAIVYYAHTGAGSSPRDVTIGRAVKDLMARNNVERYEYQFKPDADISTAVSLTENLKAVANRLAERFPILSQRIM